MLEGLGIISLARQSYVRCANRGDADFLAHRHPECLGTIELGHPDAEHVCPECGEVLEVVSGKARFERIRVVVQAQGVLRYLASAFRHLPSVTAIVPTAHAALSVTLADGRRVEVVVADYAGARERYSGLYFAEPTLYVVASDYNMPITDVLDQGRYVQLADILSEPAVRLAERLDIAGCPLPGRPHRETVEAAFDAMLARHHGWQFLEQDFMPRFFTYLAEQPERVADYLRGLKRAQGTIFGFFMVPIGAAGRADMRQIDKLDLMNNLFQGNANADAKRYGRTALQKRHIDTIVTHLEIDPLRPGRALIFLTTDRVSSSAWDWVMQLRNNRGYWKIIVLTKYMLIELIAGLGAMALLDGDEG